MIRMIDELAGLKRIGYKLLMAYTKKVWEKSLINTIGSYSVIGQTSVGACLDKEDTMSPTFLKVFKIW